MSQEIVSAVVARGNYVVFFDISIANQTVGQICKELFKDVNPIYSFKGPYRTYEKQCRVDKDVRLNIFLFKKLTLCVG